MGARVNYSNNEGYIYISPNLVPPGWKVTKYQVNWSLRKNYEDTTLPAPSLWPGQTGFYVKKSKNNNGNLIGKYVQEHFKSGDTDGTNVLCELKVASTLNPWIPSVTDPSYGTIWCAVNSVSSNDAVFTGSFCYIERV